MSASYAASVSAKTIYQADARHGWNGWSAPGWTVENGHLMANGTAGEIRVPFVPGRHHLVNYEVVVKVTVTATDIQDDTLVEFGIRLRRTGAGGYSLDFTDCQYVPCMSIRALTSPAIVLRENYADGPGSPDRSTLTFAVDGNRLEGIRHDYGPSWLGGGWTKTIRAQDSHYRAGGFAALSVGPGVHATISRVAVKQLPAT